MPSTPESVAPAVGQAKGRRILAIDPGPTESGWCLYERGKILMSGIRENEALRDEAYKMWLETQGSCTLAIEMIASYGMAVGAEVFATCVEIGRFLEAWSDDSTSRLVYRRDVKLHLCGSARAKDPNVRQALLDLLGPQGSKKAPGPLYGVKSHAWSALAVAVTVEAQLEAEKPRGFCYPFDPCPGECGDPIGNCLCPLIAASKPKHTRKAGKP